MQRRGSYVETSRIQGTLALAFFCFASACRGDDPGLSDGGTTGEGGAPTSQSVSVGSTGGATSSATGLTTTGGQGGATTTSTGTGGGVDPADPLTWKCGIPNAIGLAPSGAPAEVVAANTTLYAAFLAQDPNFPNSTDLWLRRLSLDGVSLGPDVLIATGAKKPQLAWSGSALGVAFEITDIATPHVGFRSFSADGTALTDSVDLGSGTTGRILFNGTSFVVVSPYFKFFWVSPDGMVLDSATLTPSYQVSSFDVAWSGAEYAIATVSGSGIAFQRVDSSGHNIVEVPNFLETPSGELGSPVLNWRGDHYDLGHTMTTGNVGEARVARVDPNGTLSGMPKLVTTLAVGLTSETYGYRLFSLAHNGAAYGYLVTDKRNGDTDAELYFGRADDLGTHVGTDSLVANSMSAGGVASPEILWTGEGFIASYYDGGIPLLKSVCP
jgi:hypothetical protein